MTQKVDVLQLTLGVIVMLGCKLSSVVAESDMTTDVLPVAQTVSTGLSNETSTLNADQLEVGCARQGRMSQNNKHVKEILNSLKELRIIDITNTRCFSIEEIRQSVQSIPGEDGLLQVGLYFFVRDLQQGQLEVKQNRSYTTRAAENLKCVDLIRSESQTEEAGFPKPPTMTTSTSAAGVRLGKSSEASRSDEDDDEGGLNRTQILTISTCSTIIGLFFVIALGMRVRNYIKRLRTSSMERWPSMRSTSILNKPMNDVYAAPRHSANTAVKEECSHEDEEIMKAKAQTNSSSRPPPIIVIDDKPLLVVTSASTPNSPALVGSDKSSSYAEQTGKKRGSRLSQEECPLLPSSAEVDSRHQKTYLANSHGSDASSDSEDDQGEEHNTKSPFLPQWVSELQSKLMHIGKTGDLGESDRIYIDQNSDAHPLVSSAGTGLTQSNSSVESGNPSYCYGNQKEYVEPCVSAIPVSNPPGSRRPSITLEELPEPTETSVCLEFSKSSNGKEFNDGGSSNTADTLACSRCESVPELHAADKNGTPSCANVDESRASEDTDLNNYSESHTQEEPLNQSQSLARSAEKPSEDNHSSPSNIDSCTDPPLQNRKSVKFSESENKNCMSNKEEVSITGAEDSNFLRGPDFEGMKPTYV